MNAQTPQTETKNMNQNPYLIRHFIKEEGSTFDPKPFPVAGMCRSTSSTHDDNDTHDNEMRTTTSTITEEKTGSSCDGSTSFDLEYSDDEVSFDLVHKDDDNEGSIFDDNVANAAKSSGTSAQYPTSPPTPTRLLLIDELDSKVNRMPTMISNTSDTNSGICMKIRTQPQNKSQMQMRINRQDKRRACPCCKSYIPCIHTNKSNNLIARNPNVQIDENGDEQSPTSAFTFFFDSLLPDVSRTSASTQKENRSGNFRNSSDSYGGDQGSSDRVPLRRPHEPLSPTKALVPNVNDFTDIGFDYAIKKCVKQSWLYKKGSGNDIFRSTSWKPRWCQIVIASVLGYDLDVPLLLVSWHSSIPKPSTIIILNKKIAVTINALKPDTSTRPISPTLSPLQNEIENEVAHQYRFDVVSEGQDSATSNVRTFSVESLELRNDWVKQINDAISTYTRTLKGSRRQEFLSPLPPTIPRPKAKLQKDLSSGLDGLDLAY